MKRGVGPVVAFAVVMAWAPGALAQTADELVEKHLAAMGGRAALAKLTSQKATGSVLVSAQGADIPGSVEIARKAPNKSRTLMTLDLSALGGSEMVVDQRCDGKTAFASNSMQGDREITGSQLQAMLNASFPSPLLIYKDAGATVFVAGGTHGNEIAGIMAAIVLVEHARVRKGRLIVVPHANNSAIPIS